MAYVNLFVDDFLGLSQGTTHWRCHVRSTLFRALNKVLRPLDANYSSDQKEVLYLKKIYTGDYT